MNSHDNPCGDEPWADGEGLDALLLHPGTLFQAIHGTRFQLFRPLLVATVKTGIIHIPPLGQQVRPERRMMYIIEER